MNEWLLILGILLTLWGLIEGLWTALWVDGNSAPLTGMLTTWGWKLWKGITVSRNNKMLSLAGPLILITTVVCWIVLIWLGWTVTFLSDPDSLLVKSDNSLPDFTDALWYVAYTMFTVGNGDFSPQGEGWQVVSSLVAFTGMAMVTLSITYILQVVSAVTNKRSFANQVTSIGKTAEEFVARQWTGNSFGAIELQLNSLSGELAKINEQHLAFPILHYYHAARMEKSMDVAVAILDDALTLIDVGVKEENRPSETILAAARKSVDAFLTTVKMAFIQPANDTPPDPDFSVLDKKGVPLLPKRDYQQKMKRNDHRRKLLLGLINNGSWQWPPVKE